MNITKIAGLSIAAVLVLAFVIPQLSAGALTGESKVLKSILGLTEQAKSLLSNTILPTLDTIKEDLKFKKKFWQYSFTIPPREHQFGVAVRDCNLPDKTACAFTVESIQLICTDPSICGDVTDLFVDGTETKIDPVSTIPGTNLLIDRGIGKIGASESVEIFIAVGSFTGTVEFNGEKPQGMELCVTANNVVPPTISC